jgi:pimeloyl-ACP methyl ester carboxylesterase
MRVDYAGTGDSEGNQPEVGLVDQWLCDASAAVTFVKEVAVTGIVHLIGVRSGALIASVCASKSRFDGGLVLWDAHVSGARFVRELTANSRLAYFASGPELLESVGFPYSPDMLRDLSKLDVVQSLHGNSHPVLVVTRRGQPESSLAKRLANSGAVVSSIDAENLEQMLVEPHHTRVPEAAIRSVVDWLAEISDRSTCQAIVCPTREKPALELLPENVSEDFIERPVEIGLTKMFGMLCSPKDWNAMSRPMILIGNAGSIYHIGPNRLYVMLARKLAQAGFASIRYDLANIGESPRNFHVEDNIPYPSDAVAWISDVIKYAHENLGFTSIVLTGFCSGATQAFQAALAQDRSSPLVEIIMVNPKVFYGEQAGREGDNLIMRRSSYYSRAIRDREKWRRLLTGDIDYRSLRQFAVKRIRFLVKYGQQRLQGLTGLGAGTRLGSDVTHLLKNGKRLSFFFSSRDTGYQVLIESSGGIAKRLIEHGEISVNTIENGDHTLTAKQCRDDFMERFVAQVAKTYR